MWPEKNQTLRRLPGDPEKELKGYWWLWGLRSVLRLCSLSFSSAGKQQQYTSLPRDAKCEWPCLPLPSHCWGPSLSVCMYMYKCKCTCVHLLVCGYTATCAFGHFILQGQQWDQVVTSLSQLEKCDPFAVAAAPHQTSGPGGGGNFAAWGAQSGCWVSGRKLEALAGITCCCF